MAFIQSLKVGSHRLKTAICRSLGQLACWFFIFIFFNEILLYRFDFEQIFHVHLHYLALLHRSDLGML